MTPSEKLGFKNRLFQHCSMIIEQRMHAAKQAMQQAQAAANSEDKSSAGDKYETSRAMSHLEKDLHARQLSANQQELAALLAVNVKSIHTTIAAGSVVMCSDFTFFIAAGLGKIDFEGRKVYLLAPNAPLAKALLKKQSGAEIFFNNKPMVVMDVF